MEFLGIILSGKIVDLKNLHWTVEILGKKKAFKPVRPAALKTLQNNRKIESAFSIQHSAFCIIQAPVEDFPCGVFVAKVLNLFLGVDLTCHFVKTFQIADHEGEIKIRAQIRKGAGKAVDHADVAEIVHDFAKDQNVVFVEHDFSLFYSITSGFQIGKNYKCLLCYPDEFP